ncbi:MAG: Glutaconyl-CoA decarboxylase subunit gamma [Syntrophomonadaceae bacterium]|nr:Glutaconyl-CoA decarboxylase subunit gamma [Bacillota bacterium]
MRMFKITVNGKSYDVAVEEIAADSRSKPQFMAARPSTPAAPAAMPVTEVPAKPVTEKKVPAPPSTEADNTVVVAPMPGTILNILVKEGTIVKGGDVLLILEAMKMENEIVSPVAGKVKKVAVSKGGSVNTGEVLVVIEQ